MRAILSPRQIIATLAAGTLWAAVLIGALAVMP
jgi:hypothetical protein